jgi:hypothetical protein
MLDGGTKGAVMKILGILIMIMVLVVLIPVRKGGLGWQVNRPTG